MATAPVTPSLTPEQAVDFIVNEVRRTQLTPSKAIDASNLLDTFDAVALRWLARVGLIREVGDRLHDEREDAARDARAPVPRTGFRGDGSNPRTRSVLASIAMEDASGGIKPLEDFNFADTEALRIVCEKQATGWGRRSQWAARAGELLKRNKKASRVVELPEKSVAELRQLAAEAWS